MKKIFAILLISSIFNTYVNARDTRQDSIPRLTFGIEWGYIASLHTGYHYNYIAPEGFRVDNRGSSFGYASNADMYLHLGYNLDRNWNLAVYLGYAGVTDFHHVLPVSVRGTRYFRENPSGDRWLTFLDIGSGICLKTPIQEIFSAKTGAGYRLSLSKDTKMDLLFAVRTTFTHPTIYYDSNRINMDDVNRNNAFVSALSVGIGLTF